MLHFWWKIFSVFDCRHLGTTGLNWSTADSDCMWRFWQWVSREVTVWLSLIVLFSPYSLTLSVCEVICSFVFLVTSFIWLGIKVILTSLNELEIVSFFFHVFYLCGRNFFNWRGTICFNWRETIKMFSLFFSQFW